MVTNYLRSLADLVFSSHCSRYINGLLFPDFTDFFSEKNPLPQKARPDIFNRSRKYNGHRLATYYSAHLPLLPLAFPLRQSEFSHATVKLWEMVPLTMAPIPVSISLTHGQLLSTSPVDTLSPGPVADSPNITQRDILDVEYPPIPLSQFQVPTSKRIRG